MRAQIITGGSAVALAVVGWALPLVFPHVEPWVAKGLLAVSALMLLAIFILWIVGLKTKPGEAGLTQATTGTGSPNFRDVTGGVHFHSPPPPPLAPNGPTITPLDEQQAEAELARLGRRKLHAPEADFPINGVLVRLYKIFGPPPQDDAGRKHFQRKLDLEIADKAHQKQMWVWGRIGDFPIDRISPNYLKRGKFDHIRRTFSAHGMHAVRPTIWTDLKFNKAEVDEVWPDE